MSDVHESYTIFVSDFDEVRYHSNAQEMPHFTMRVPLPAVKVTQVKCGGLYVGWSFSNIKIYGNIIRVYYVLF